MPYVRRKNAYYHKSEFKSFEMQSTVITFYRFAVLPLELVEIS